VVILIGAELFRHGNDLLDAPEPGRGSDLLDAPEPGRGSEKATDEGFDLRRWVVAKRRSL